MVGTKSINLISEEKMDWLVDRLKEKSTYVGLGTIALNIAGEAIPFPFAGEIINYVAGLVLIGIKEENKNG